jgi:integrase
MLTEKGIAKLKTKRGRYKAGEVKGLCLQVTEAGVTSWLLRYELAGRERWMGLGPYPLFKLKEARERARAARKLIADGIDPLEAKRQARAAKAPEAAKTVKFEKAAQESYDAIKSSWRSARTGAQFQSSLRAYVLPIIGSLPVREIDKALVLKVIRPEWDIKTETMNRVRMRIEAALDFAAVSGYRPEGDNPARWAGHLEHVLPARQRIQRTVNLPALPFQQIPEFMAALRQCEGIAARALEFTILTAVRTGATLAAKWEQIDLDARMWTFAVIKGGKHREHRTPLCNRVLEILKALPRDGDLVFDGLLKATACCINASSTASRINRGQADPSTSSSMTAAPIFGDLSIAWMRRPPFALRLRQRQELTRYLIIWASRPKLPGPDYTLSNRARPVPPTPRLPLYAVSDQTRAALQ